MRLHDHPDDIKAFKNMTVELRGSVEEFKTLLVDLREVIKPLGDFMQLLNPSSGGQRTERSVTDNAGLKAPSTPVK
ncbi:hypothetical protein E8E12_000069, partial [Didymella heteroderae]